MMMKNEEEIEQQKEEEKILQQQPCASSSSSLLFDDFLQREFIEKSTLSQQEHLSGKLPNLSQRKHFLFLQQQKLKNQQNQQKLEKRENLTSNHDKNDKNDENGEKTSCQVSSTESLKKNLPFYMLKDERLMQNLIDLRKKAQFEKFQSKISPIEISPTTQQHQQQSNDNDQTFDYEGVGAENYDDGDDNDENSLYPVLLQHLNDDEEENGGELSEKQNFSAVDNNASSLSFKMNSLFMLRERSALARINHQLSIHRYATQLCSRIITEVTDELCASSVKCQVKKEWQRESLLDMVLEEIVSEFIFGEKEFVELTPKDTAQIQRLLNDRNREKQICEKFNIPITVDKMACLAPFQWLNDEVINFYLNMIRERSLIVTPPSTHSTNHVAVKNSPTLPNGSGGNGNNGNSGNSGGEKSMKRLPKVHCFNTFFYQKLVNPRTSQYTYGGVRTWTRKIDLFSHDKVLIPVHLGNHWVLAVINLRDERFEYYDSMISNDRVGKQVLQHLKQYLMDEHRDKKKSELSAVADWPMYVAGANEYPQQANSWDCGVFTCKCANWVAQDKEIDFAQRNMQYFRNRMVLELKTGHLL